MPKERNTFVDMMRGIAMLLVVLGHTMTGVTANSQESVIYNIIWSLQMPLFILISGYVTRYSREISSFKGLLSFLGKRTLSYLLPFAVWSFVIRGLILGRKDFLDIKYMLWHMDNGYWFLITIWTISMIFGISSLVSSLVKSSVTGKQILLFASYICGMALLGAVGYLAGMSFFCIKLTLYYMPFYFAGYLYGQYRDKIFALSFGKRAVDITVAICFAAWIFTLARVNLFSLADGGKDIIIRAAASLSGCIAVCGLLKAATGEKTNEGGVPVGAQMDRRSLSRDIRYPLHVLIPDSVCADACSDVAEGRGGDSGEFCGDSAFDRFDRETDKFEQGIVLLPLREKKII